MKATVVIPNLNGAGWLKDSIESIFSQTMQDFELIVVDNGSTDESKTIAQSYVGRPNYTLIENESNTGFSHAVNQGIQLAKGQYVALFNNDAFAEPDWLQNLIIAAEQDPRIFAVSSLMIRHFERELADDAGDYVTFLPTTKMWILAGEQIASATKMYIAPLRNATIFVVPPQVLYGTTLSKAFKVVETVFYCPTKICLC